MLQIRKYCDSQIASKGESQVKGSLNNGTT